jgi:hypothetical protein
LPCAPGPMPAWFLSEWIRWCFLAWCVSTLRSERAFREKLRQGGIE